MKEIEKPLISKVALVTGAGRGIGEAIARLLAVKGAIVEKYGSIDILINNAGVLRPTRFEEIGEEVAALVFFLVSEESSYITGASIDINGGDLMI